MWRIALWRVKALLGVEASLQAREGQSLGRGTGLVSDKTTGYPISVREKALWPVEDF